MRITATQIELGEAISRLVMSWLAFFATFICSARSFVPLEELV